MSLWPVKVGLVVSPRVNFIYFFFHKLTILLISLFLIGIQCKSVLKNQNITINIIFKEINKIIICDNCN